MAPAPPPPPVITVLGSLNVDLVFRVPHHPLPGETLTANSFAVHCGGKGANQAAACAKLTRPRPLQQQQSGEVPLSSAGREGDAAAVVRMVGAVGDDGYGRMLVANLRELGVDCGGVRLLASAPSSSAAASGEADGGKEAASEPVATGMANIIVDEPTGQNRIVLSPGANALVLGDAFLDLAIPPAAATDAASGSPQPPAPRPSLLILQLETPLETATAALRRAREQGVPALLNPAPARDDLPPETFDGLAHLVLNETEAAILSRCAVEELDTEDGLERVVRGFAARAVRYVVVTLGGRGSYYFQSAAAPAAAGGQGEKKGLVPAEKVRVVDTTGAGDTWVGQYAAEVVAASAAGREFDIEAAVRRAGRAAAKAVQKQGAQDSIPWMDEV